MTRLARTFLFPLIVVMVSVLLPAIAFATPVTLDWGSFSATGLTTYGVYDTDNSTVLQTGDLVQLIWVGPNGVVDIPATDGAPGGDDVLLDSSAILNEEPLAPPQRNKGYIPLKTYTFDDSLSGRIIYIRAWNSATASTATAYGASQTGILAGGTIFNALRWNTSAPLAVQLAEFSATALPDAVLVRWATVSEVDSQGFNLYRSQSPVAPVALLAFVPSHAPGSSQGFAYEWQDTDVLTGQTYHYWLESLDMAGHGTFSGPVSAIIQAPTAVGLTSFAASFAHRWRAVGLATIMFCLLCVTWVTRRAIPRGSRRRRQ
jgi:hypothetical protein